MLLLLHLPSLCFSLYPCTVLSNYLPLSSSATVLSAVTFSSGFVPCCSPRPSQCLPSCSPSSPPLCFSALVLLHHYLCVVPCPYFFDPLRSVCFIICLFSGFFCPSLSSLCFALCHLSLSPAPPTLSLSIPSFIFLFLTSSLRFPSPSSFCL